MRILLLQWGRIQVGQVAHMFVIEDNGNLVLAEDVREVRF